MKNDLQLNDSIWIRLKSALKSVDNNTSHTNCVLRYQEISCVIFSVCMFPEKTSNRLYVILTFDLCYCFHFVQNIGQMVSFFFLMLIYCNINYSNYSAWAMRFFTPVFIKSSCQHFSCEIVEENTVHSFSMCIKDKMTNRFGEEKWFAWMFCWNFSRISKLKRRRECNTHIRHYTYKKKCWLHTVNSPVIQRCAHFLF